MLEAVAQLASWFESRSLDVLGRFTCNVDAFLSGLQRCSASREDALLCGRSRSEYHLNMVGTELLNRAYRRSFRSAPRHLVLLPACMPLKADGGCRARGDGALARCQGCAPDCRVHQITQLGAKMGADVFVLQEGVDQFIPRMASRSQSGDLGILGVSCVLTNAPAGLAAGMAGIPVQGALLDYCGCAWHWHDRGIPTDVNLRRLRRILRPDDSAGVRWKQALEPALTEASGL